MKKEPKPSSLAILDMHSETEVYPLLCTLATLVIIRVFTTSMGFVMQMAPTADVPAIANSLHHGRLGDAAVMRVGFSRVDDG